MLKQILLLIITVFLAINVNSQEQYVILVSLDGFRWDYCSKAETPIFDSIAKFGVKAESLQPSFPTKTFPNHYTLVTGLYPNNHGIVNNSFYSPTHDSIYSISNRATVEDGSYYSGTPIWNLAESQGVKAASYFWVGSEADIEKRKPSYWKRYEHYFPFEQRVDSVISWLRLPENKQPHLILLYFHEPDSKGHKYGPDSDEIIELIPRLDSLVARLFNGLKTLKIKEKVNVIITSDHGMSEVSKEKTVNLLNYIDEKWIERVIGSNPVFNIWAKENYKDSISNALSKVKHLQFLENDRIPERLNYGSNKRTGTYTVFADSSWSVQYKSNYYSHSKGAHGYDNQNTDMHSIFYAIGPSFKTGYNSSTIKNIDIYPLIAHILGLEIPPIDGSLDRIKHILKD